MKISIDGTPKEIAALVLELQERHGEKPIELRLEAGECESKAVFL